MARLALVFSGGAALALLPGHFSPPAFVAALAALAPIPTSRRPSTRAFLVLALLAGLVAGWGARALPESTAPGRRDAVASSARDLPGWSDRRGDALAARIDSLYGAQAPMVRALTLARRDGLDPAVREDFARSGTAHLLAISGFHVGVVAGVLLTVLRLGGLSRRRAALAAVMGVWAYVGLIGFPDAASRAALILTVVAASRARGRPAARWGGLGTALLLLVATDPQRLASPGFQLSFAGAGGLVAWAGPVARRLHRLRWSPSVLVSPAAAGVAATLATMPVVAWHFERVSLVGIPATVVATPVLVVALPGALLSLLADAVHPGVGRFLAGGVGLCLAVLEGGVHALAAPSWASVWISRDWVTMGLLGAGLVGVGLGPVRGPVRRAVRWVGVVAGIVAWPGLLAVQGRDTAEIVMVDVGQGDAVAVRTPAGRWILVDAGPPWRGDPGAAPLVRTLRRRGVDRLEALVLTHPDVDHIGGAPAVLASFDVGVVFDPAHAVGKGDYLALLEGAAEAGVPWRAARAGAVMEWDGVELRVLAPFPDGTVGASPDADANGRSVVLALRFGDFDALLTGDAPVDVERAVLPGVPRELEVLKVGHHGSATSTGPALLEHAPPAVALISVGRRNRYGHPEAGVLRRLVEAGASVYRTDRRGTLRVVGRADGRYEVRWEGSGRR